VLQVAPYSAELAKDVFERQREWPRLCARWAGRSAGWAAQPHAAQRKERNDNEKAALAWGAAASKQISDQAALRGGVDVAGRVTGSVGEGAKVPVEFPSGF
jgi:hypothetical protein